MIDRDGNTPRSDADAETTTKRAPDAAAEAAAGAEPAEQLTDVDRDALGDVELSIHEAAALLGVPSLWLMNRLDRENIPYCMVGTHRRIKVKVVEALRERIASGEIPYHPVDPEVRRQALRGISGLGLGEPF